MNIHEKQPILTSATSSPTGEIFTFGQEDRKVQIAVRRQKTPETCGQACLEMLGHSLEEIEFDESLGVSTADLFWTFNAEEVSDIDSVDFKSDDTYMIVGTKIKTGCDHWYLRIGDIIINPETGEVEKADKYQQREIGEIKAIVPIPFVG